MQSVNNLSVLRVKGNNKAIQLSDQQWYSTYAAMENPPAVGATVSFQYDTKDYNGATFRNIKSDIQVTGGAPAQSAPAGNTGGGGGSNYRQEDPVKQRSIVRQNAVARAVEILQIANTVAELNQKSVEDITQEAIMCAAQIEDFTSGREDAVPAAEPDFNDAIPPAFNG